MLKSLLQIIGGSLVVAIAATMGLQVFQRYVLNQSLPWPDELIGNLLAALTFVGGALAMRDDEHIRVRFFESLLPANKAWPLRLVADLISITFLLTIAWASWPIVQRMWSIDLTTLAVPVGLFMATVPICCAVMTFYTLRNTIRQMQGLDEAPFAEGRTE